MKGIFLQNKIKAEGDEVSLIPKAINSRKLFLASASPRRAQIMRDHGIIFTIIPNLLAEEIIQPKYRLRTALRLIAKQKAIQSQANYQGLILSVDTVVVIDQDVLGKPADLVQASKMLQKLSGCEHQVISSLCLLDTITQKCCTRSTITRVTFKNLSLQQIQRYCQNNNVLDKAGGYAIQENGQALVAKIHGSYHNVVGLPIKSLLGLLRNYVIV